MNEFRKVNEFGEDDNAFDFNNGKRKKHKTLMPCKIGSVHFVCA